MKIVSKAKPVFGVPKPPPAFGARPKPRHLEPHIRGAGQALPPLAPRGTPAPALDWNFLYNTFLHVESNNPSLDRLQGVFHPSSGLHPDVENCKRSIIFDLIHAERSRQDKSPKLIKILDNGTNQHTGVQEKWKKMAEMGFSGITAVEVEKKAVFGPVPISGSADWLATIAYERFRHVVLFDLKTMKSADWKVIVMPTKKHRLQVNTYLGVLGITTGYLIYENKDNQEWATPLENFRVDFDFALFQETLQYCVGILEDVARQEIPAFDQELCDKCIDFCSYKTACDLERDGHGFTDLDARPADVRRRHLAVVA